MFAPSFYALYIILPSNAITIIVNTSFQLGSYTWTSPQVVITAISEIREFPRWEESYIFNIAKESWETFRIIDLKKIIIIIQLVSTGCFSHIHLCRSATFLFMLYMGWVKYLWMNLVSSIFHIVSNKKKKACKHDMLG